MSSCSCVTGPVSYRGVDCQSNSVGNSLLHLHYYLRGCGSLDFRGHVGGSVPQWGILLSSIPAVSWPENLCGSDCRKCWTEMAFPATAFLLNSFSGSDTMWLPAWLHPSVLVLPWPSLWAQHPGAVQVGVGTPSAVRAKNCPSFEDLFSFQMTEPSLSPSASVHERARLSLSCVM